MTPCCNEKSSTLQTITLLQCILNLLNSLSATQHCSVPSPFAPPHPLPCPYLHSPLHLLKGQIHCSESGMAVALHCCHIIPQISHCILQSMGGSTCRSGRQADRQDSLREHIHTPTPFQHLKTCASIIVRQKSSRADKMHWNASPLLAAHNVTMEGCMKTATTKDLCLPASTLCVGLRSTSSRQQYGCAQDTLLYISQSTCLL